MIAIDLPGFGDSDKPLTRRLRRALLRPTRSSSCSTRSGSSGPTSIGNSMGGRIAIELGLHRPERVGKLVLLAPALAWLRERTWKWLAAAAAAAARLPPADAARAVEPIVRRLVPGGERGWTAAGVDEFLRAYCTPAGRSAFYECARNIYMDEPYGEDGLLDPAAELAPDTMFVWGRQDKLVPIGFMRHVERALPAARHVELDCGHVPQMERPTRDERGDARLPGLAALDLPHLGVDLGVRDRLLAVDRPGAEHHPEAPERGDPERPGDPVRVAAVIREQPDAARGRR